MNRSFLQILSLVLILVLLGGGFLFLGPLKDDVTALKTQVDQKSGDLQTLQARYDELKALADEVAKSEAKKEELLASVPKGHSEDQLILELQQITKELKYEVNAMNFALSRAESFGNTISVTANFKGKYDDLVAFLQKIENAKRLMRVSSVSAQLTSTEDLVFNLMIEAYYQ